MCDSDKRQAGAEIKITPEMTQAALEAYAEFESERYVGVHLKEALRAVLLAALAVQSESDETRADHERDHRMFGCEPSHR